ncbi:formate dehydrogenase accessory protein FdhE [Necropsobacter massiliensis]|uniref:formate dehydrogenase accessory protein FdhE n=1 Tax=Necropsobacter massiliensis TaxID=1400001 RepID=UPI000595A1F6|nr:formate dehydrogenase accessory protein FdhE [Necropsobacter massiliensis]
MAIRILPESELQKASDSYQRPALLFSNPKNLYARRVERLKALAENHPLADYLRFAASVAAAQLNVLTTLPLAKNHLENQKLDQYIPLNAAHWQRDPYWRQALRALLTQLKADANDTVRDVITYLEQASDDELEQIADELLAQNLSEQLADKAVFIWAALSLYWVQLTEQIPHGHNLENTQQLHHCPVCGSAPVSSLVHFGASQGLRYLHCSLCESEWNLMRAQCTNCGHDGKVSYWTLDNEMAAVRAESCGDCNSYLKILFQEKDHNVEPVADDLAAIFLDIELEEKGFARSGQNPFMFAAQQAK